MKLYVIMHDETQQACPIEANSAEEAHEKIGTMLGADVSGCPVYDIESEDDMRAVISILANHLSIHN